MNNLICNSFNLYFKIETKNLQSKLDNTENIYKKMTTDILSFKEKISICAKEEAETKKELQNVTKKVKHLLYLIKYF